MTVGHGCDHVGKTLADRFLDRLRCSRTHSKIDDHRNVLFAGLLFILGLACEVAKDFNELLVQAPVGGDDLVELEELLLELGVEILCDFCTQEAFVWVFKN
jgi:hypothetical protein